MGIIIVDLRVFITCSWSSCFGIGDGCDDGVRGFDFVSIFIEVDCGDVYGEVGWWSWRCGGLGGFETFVGSVSVIRDREITVSRLWWLRWFYAIASGLLVIIFVWVHD